MSTRSTAPTSLTDVLLGVLLAVAGAFLLVGAYLQVIPSLPGLAAYALGAGAVGVLGALIGRTSAGFFSEIVSAALVCAWAVVALRFPGTPPATLLLLAGALFGANGIVRVASWSEYPSLRGIFLIGGAASLALAAAVLSGAVPATLQSLSVLISVELVVDGASAVVIGRHEHPSRSGR